MKSTSILSVNSLLGVTTVNIVLAPGAIGRSIFLVTLVADLICIVPASCTHGADPKLWIKIWMNSVSSSPDSGDSKERKETVGYFSTALSRKFDNGDS